MEVYEGYMYRQSGDHVVLVDIQCGKYKGQLICEMGGNCFGGDILNSVISSVSDGDVEYRKNEVNCKHVVFENYPNSTPDPDYFDYASEYKLYDSSDNQLLIDYEEISNYIVGVKIISYAVDR